MGTPVTPRAHLATTLSLIVFALPVTAQQQPAPPQPTLPIYDVVSIHPHSALDDHAGFSDPPDGFVGANITLRDLVSYAYHVREDLISGLPAWVDSTHLDITVKVSDPDHSALDKLTREQTRTMLSPVLADRFRLKVHTQLSILSVYDLVLLKDGPKFHTSASLPGDLDHPTPKTPHRKPSWQISSNSLIATALPMSVLTNALAAELDRTVIDKTGLTDAYDLSLKWTPDEDSNNATDNGAADHPPDLFTALQEQLGLKLVPSKGPVAILVVDHAEKPSPN